jgi:hypothetical protein
LSRAASDPMTRPAARGPTSASAGTRILPDGPGTQARSWPNAGRRACRHRRPARATGTGNRHGQADHRSGAGRSLRWQTGDGVILDILDILTPRRAAARMPSCGMGAAASGLRPCRLPSPALSTPSTRWRSIGRASACASRHPSATPFPS